MASCMSSKLELVIWSGDTGHYWHTWKGGRSYGRTVVRSYGLTVSKTKFSRTDGLPYFLTHGAPLRAPMVTYVS